MSFVNGFVGLLSSVTGGAATELVTPGYTRQPISFARPINGSSPSATPYSFPVLGTPGPSGNSLTFAGRAVWDAPTGGNLLLVMPLPAPRSFPGGGPAEVVDVGNLHLFLTAMAAYPDGDAFSGTFAAATVIGSHFDETSIINRAAVDPTTGRYTLQANMAQLWSGAALKVTRGVLAAA